MAAVVVVQVIFRLVSSNWQCAQWQCDLECISFEIRKNRLLRFIVVYNCDERTILRSSVVHGKSWIRIEFSLFFGSFSLIGCAACDKLEVSVRRCRHRNLFLCNIDAERYNRFTSSMNQPVFFISLIPHAPHRWCRYAIRISQWSIGSDRTRHASNERSRKRRKKVFDFAIEYDFNHNRSGDSFDANTFCDEIRFDVAIYGYFSASWHFIPILIDDHRHTTVDDRVLVCVDLILFSFLCQVAARNYNADEKINEKKFYTNLKNKNFKVFIPLFCVDHALLASSVNKWTKNKCECIITRNDQQIFADRSKFTRKQNRSISFHSQSRANFAYEYWACKTK